jgi:hypothetical protein
MRRAFLNANARFVVFVVFVVETPGVYSPLRFVGQPNAGLKRSRIGGPTRLACEMRNHG